MRPIEMEKLREARGAIEGILDGEDRLCKANLPDKVAHENLAFLSMAVLKILDVLEGREG